jgi:hypothetical protein
MMSLVVPIMNRSDRMMPCLLTWIKEPDIDEIIIVDWSSRVPIKTDASLKKIVENPKTKIVRVQNEQYFISMSFSLNVGVFNAKNDQIIKCDIDYQLIDSDLFKIFKEADTEKEFYCGTVAPLWHFHGFCFFSKKYFLKINGYNEKCRGWGYDDMDFYARLEKNGLKKNVIENISSFLYHIPHSDELKTENYPEENKNHHETNQINGKITNQEACGCLSEYKTIKSEQNYLELERVK